MYLCLDLVLDEFDPSVEKVEDGLTVTAWEQCKQEFGFIKKNFYVIQRFFV